ncbi:hypothetical protein [Duganella violaceipulchra]|uniref:Uncharacterized protein n=1 Tax=Duganella violaceipulchra TaxID=2849652 RepID=A0AA41L1J1_9BURK|nr:hypothetical protein [Duganella violaceicalia]MBV6324896.1 hypothetical protein [Duganella violaceicalia]MCP2012355.1 hypothetical protein [Duganella violaceicalia]
MHTFSFQYTSSTDDTDYGMPEGGYAITLHGDTGKPTRFELESVMGNTPRAFLRLAANAAPQELKFEIKDERDQLDHLRSKHYVLHVVRNDGRPMQQHEVQLALLLYTMERTTEPVFSLPGSTLRTLLLAERSLSEALVAAMENATPWQRDVHILDEGVAAGLVELGLVTPTDEADHYALMDIEVR